MRRKLTWVIAVLLQASVVAAQSNPQGSHWGISGGFVPTWQVPSAAEFLFDADDVNLRGNEFRIGVVRGRMLAGDWGVSLIRKSFASGANLEAGTGTQCSGSTSTGVGCTHSWSVWQASGLTLTGAEVHKFVPFGTIRRRVQIGINFAGGIAWAQGDLTRHNFMAESVQPFPTDITVTPTRPMGGLGNAREVSSEPVRFRDVFFLGETDLVPLGKLEAAVAGIVSSGLKLRVSGGVNFPGTHRVAVMAIYLFGASAQ